MEWLFRRHFWVVVLVVLTIAAAFSALIVNSFVGYRLSKAFPTKPKVQQSVMAPQETKARVFSISNERNLFNARREKVVLADVDEEADTGSCERWEEAQPSSQRLRLIGTAVFANPSDSLALIEDSQARVQNYSINECLEDGIVMDPLAMEILGAPDPKQVYPCNKVADGVVQRIDVNRVYIYNTHERRCEYLSATEETEALPPPKPSVPAAPSASSGKEFGKGVRKTGPNSFEIPSNELSEALENLSEISTQARLVPAFEDGKPIGFRVFSVRPNSVFSKIGLENGDVITRVNGYELNSPEKGLELYQRLKTSQEFSIDLKRGGAPMSFTYSVK